MVKIWLLLVRLLYFSTVESSPSARLMLESIINSKCIASTICVWLSSIPKLSMVWNMLNCSHTKERRGGIGELLCSFSTCSPSICICICIQKQIHLYLQAAIPISQWVSNVFGYRIYRAWSQLKSRQILSSEKCKIYKNIWFRAYLSHDHCFFCCYWNNFVCFWFKSFQLRFSEPWDLSTYFVRPQGFSPSCYSAQNSQSVFSPVYVLGNISIYNPIYLVKG